MNERHRFHSICPYFAMFPEAFVRRNVLAWSKRDDVILDPFSGRGTTVFESLLNGRKGLGCDTNPVAVCLSKAKADPPALNEVLERLAELEKGSRRFTSKAPEVTKEFFTLCFHAETLRQLLFLMKKVDWRNDRTDCFIAALALGLSAWRKPSDGALLQQSDAAHDKHETSVFSSLVEGKGVLPT